MLVGVTLLALATHVAPKPVADPAVLSVAEECQAALTYTGRTAADQEWLNSCVHALTPPTPAPTTPAPTPSATVAPTPTPTATATPPAATWPGADNTGVPVGVALTPWTGSCNITTAGVTIDARTFNCDVTIRAAGVNITRSRINGWISSASSNSSFKLTDSEVVLNRVDQLTVVGDHHFTLLRTEVVGGNRGAYCSQTCDIRDSWIHGQQIRGEWHASAVRMEQGLTLIHNTLVCDAQPASEEGTCSASLTGYGDFAAVQNNLIQGNYFPPTVLAAYCAYGGSSKGKPYSAQTNNIKFLDNVFGRGTTTDSRNCARYGAIGDWNPSAPGNVWTNNKYSDGTVIPNRVS